LLPLSIWSILTATTVAVFMLVRRAALQRLGGFTGDVAGALVELVELSLLLALSFCVVG
ncbi:MAG: adenosylcobinamide-GDP ribazoletransferase, partial [Halieaceae bacterium]|nr:adenosylcobinamide-GDP ribazoletransferase [Halieaceae bacterium]